MRFGFTRARLEFRVWAAILTCLAIAPHIARAAADPTPLLRQLHVQDQAVERVGFQLASANADLCRPVREAGFSVHTIEQYREPFRGAALELFDLGRAPGVLAVAPGSPADAAGLREADAILEVDGQATPDPPAKIARPDFSRTAAVQMQIAKALQEPVLKLTIQRDGTTIQLEIHPVGACRSLFQVIPGRELKGEADGAYVQVSSELMALASSDDELAALLAHELAHNVLGHRARLDALHVDRGLFAIFGRNGRLIRETEQEADRLGVYLLARAGYDPHKALAFWIHVRKADPGSAGDPTHPSWPERLKSIQAEIRRLDEAGAPALQVPLPPDLAAELPPRL